MPKTDSDIDTLFGPDEADPSTVLLSDRFYNQPNHDGQDPFVFEEVSDDNSAAGMEEIVTDFFNSDPPVFSNYRSYSSDSSNSDTTNTSNSEDEDSHDQSEKRLPVPVVSNMTFKKRKIQENSMPPFSKIHELMYGCRTNHEAIDAIPGGYNKTAYFEAYFAKIAQQMGVDVSIEILRKTSPKKFKASLPQPELYEITYEKKSLTMQNTFAFVKFNTIYAAIINTKSATAAAVKLGFTRGDFLIHYLDKFDFGPRDDDFANNYLRLKYKYPDTAIKVLLEKAGHKWDESLSQAVTSLRISSTKTCVSYHSMLASAKSNREPVADDLPVAKKTSFRKVIN